MSKVDQEIVWVEGFIIKIRWKITPEYLTLPEKYREIQFKQMKSLFSTVTALILALSASFLNLHSQEKLAKGIIIYDPSKLGDEFAQAQVFFEIIPHGVTTDIVTSEGEKIKIVSGQIQALVNFPFESYSPEEWQTVADKLGELAPKYPRVKSILQELETVARKHAVVLSNIHAEEAQRKQRIEALEAHQAKQIGRVITFKDNAGESYENVKLEAIEPDGITISDSGARKKILFTEVSEEVRKFLGYDPKAAAEYIEEKKEREEQERRLAAAKIAQEKQLEAERRKRQEMAQAAAQTARARAEEDKKVRKIVELLTDTEKFANRRVTIEGAIKPSTSRYGVYELVGLERYWCFEVYDGELCYCYVKKNSEVGSSLRQEILDSNSGRLRGAIILEDVEADSRVVWGDIVGYGPPSEYSLP